MKQKREDGLIHEISNYGSDLLGKLIVSVRVSGFRLPPPLQPLQYGLLATSQINENISSNVRVFAQELVAYGLLSTMPWRLLPLIPRLKFPARVVMGMLAGSSLQELVNWTTKPVGWAVHQGLHSQMGRWVVKQSWSSLLHSRYLRPFALSPNYRFSHAIKYNPVVQKQKPDDGINHLFDSIASQPKPPIEACLSSILQRCGIFYNVAKKEPQKKTNYRLTCQA